MIIKTSILAIVNAVFQFAYFTTNAVRNNAKLIHIQLIASTSLPFALVGLTDATHITIQAATTNI